ncbi:MAG: TIGR01777 family oxidoreductase [Bacteroidetes bacterium]|nr:TIGR01777 family oxidoreductase [Bacteroidota bacterium]
MKIAVSGYRGFVGSELVSVFKGRGFEVVPLSRTLLYSVDGSLEKMLEGIPIIVNLAGAPIMKRWTARYKDDIYNSRIVTTRRLVSAIHQLENPPELFISTSATGIYENGGPYTESNALLSGSFLGKLCQDWEREAFIAEDSCRVVIFRLGVVLDSKKGALAKLLPVFRAGLGGRLGNGKQPFPWIHVSDLTRACLFALENQGMKGAFNLTAPQIIDNRQFTKTLADVLNKPAWFTVPSFALRLLYGQGSTTLLAGQAVIPERLENLGFSFHFPQLAGALKNLLEKGEDNQF